MLKKFFAVVSLLTLTLCAGCGSEQKTIRIGLMPDVDSLPFIIAQERGYFDEEKVSVELLPFKSAMDRDAALQSGSLDGEVSDIFAAAFLKSGGFDIKITSATDGSYKLTSNKDIQNIKGLEGKEIAISKGTIIEYVTDRILEQENVTDVEKVIIPQIPTRLEMLRSGKIAAATLPEPMASIAVHNGAHFLIGSEELRINPGVMIFTEAALKDRKNEVQSIYRAYNKAARYLNETKREDYIDLAVEKSGFPEIAKEALTLPHYNKASLPKEEDIEDCIDWLNKSGQVKHPFDYNDLVTDILP